MSRVITESVWRNFVPVAPHRTVTVYRGMPTDISLKDILIQGARDLETGEKDLDVIDQKGAQRGWLCRYFNISRPEHGRLSNSSTGDGFRYLAASDYVGPDCFTYVMNAATQNSLPGRIDIVVKNYLGGRIVISEDRNQRTANSCAFRYVAQWYIPPEFGTYKIVTATWYEHRPKRVLRGDTLFVETEKVEISSTTIQTVIGTRASDARFHVINHNLVLPSVGFMERTWPDLSLRGAYDGVSGKPYVQPPGPYPVSVKLTFRDFSVEQHSYDVFGYTRVRYRPVWTRSDSIEVDVRDIYGPNWWKSGAIQDDSVHRPTYGTYVPDIVEVPVPAPEPEPDPEPDPELGYTPIPESEIPLWNKELDFQHRIAAGDFHSILLRPDSTVYAWGLNVAGQTNAPRDIKFDYIASGEWNGLGIDREGVLHVWGYDQYGFITDSPAGIDNCKKVQASFSHGVLLRNSGEVIGWVANASGDDDDTSALDGMPVFDSSSAGPEIKDFKCGEGFTLVLYADGTLGTWGHLPESSDTTTIGPLPDTNNFKAIAACRAQAMALTEDGTIVSWAHNSDNVPAGPGWKHIVCGASFAVAVHEDGHIEAWGHDADGQVTNAPTGTAWEDVKFLNAVAGYRHAIAVTIEGTMVGWGDSQYGQSTIPDDYSIVPNEYIT